ncbi:hypothetical protein E3N88_16299 [Mikania micrantha]|uniref:Uncharacterized protein n=1 Tax=Mikania micrantha TaxID=192012 RepID=A0A5N6NY33_9ASTR|nr:hypothetical protein E3N88_16299 [Mikania micrantha]
MRKDDRSGYTPMQVLFSMFRSKNYVHKCRVNNVTNAFEDLFFIHPKYFPIWRAPRHVCFIFTPFLYLPAWCMTDTFASYESKRPGGHIYMGGYVTHIARCLGVFGADVEASMTTQYHPERIGRATLSAMRIATDIRGVEFRVPLQPPPRGRRLVFRDPGRLDRIEDLVAWKSADLIAVATHLRV